MSPVDSMHEQIGATNIGEAVDDTDEGNQNDYANDDIQAFDCDNFVLKQPTTTKFRFCISY